MKIVCYWGHKLYATKKRQNKTEKSFSPLGGYALNLKALIKVSKVSWTSQLSYEILRSSFERKFDKTNFISPKRTPPKSPHLLGLKGLNFKNLSPGKKLVHFKLEIFTKERQRSNSLDRVLKIPVKNKFKTNWQFQNTSCNFTRDLTSL